AEKFATAIRNHWHVENNLHWRLDVVMNEDDCKIRRGNAAELFSGIRHIAINVLTNDKVFKAGLRRKMQGKIIRSSLFVLNNSHFMFKN
ncbi:ISAs1 family transposase, partial [Shigella boydii]